MEPRNRLQGMNYACLCSLAGRYDNPIPTRFLAPIDCFPNFETFKELKNRFQGIDFASLCSLAGRFDKPIPTRFPALINCLKIPALFSSSIPAFVDPDSSRVECTDSHNHHFLVLHRENGSYSTQVGWGRGDK
jgi:hypothetical protein